MAEMKVETFEVQETTSGMQDDVSEDVRNLIEKLELDGQKKLITGESKSLVPYRKMTQEEVNVYKTLCPESTWLKNYDEHIIPLRVLQVASHATSLKFFERIEVWHPTSQRTKDPVLVGMAKDDWREAFYILARWGRELAEFSELRDAAQVQCLQSYRANLTGIRSKVESAIQSAEVRVQQFINGESNSVTPSFYE